MAGWAIALDYGDQAMLRTRRMYVLCLRYRYWQLLRLGEPKGEDVP